MTIVVFKSKAEVFSFLDKVRSLGVNGQIISMPKEIKIGCGLAVGVNDNYVNACKSIVYTSDFTTFHGIYKLKKLGLKSSLSRIL